MLVYTGGMRFMIENIPQMTESDEFLWEIWEV